MSPNFVTHEFHVSDACVFGECLKVIGRKFKPNPKQNFVKIEGPADCWVYKTCSTGVCSVIKSSQELKNFKIFGCSIGDGFRKKKNLIVEPEKGYDGPDYSGGGKHAGKAYSHTPITQYNVNATGSIFALGYIDMDRQKRSGNIELVKVSLNKEYSKS